MAAGGRSRPDKRNYVLTLAVRSDLGYDTSIKSLRRFCTDLSVLRKEREVLTLETLYGRALFESGTFNRM